MGDLCGQGRGVRRAGQDMARDNRETGGVDLADLVPRDGDGTRHVPGRLGAPGHREAIDVERAVAYDRPAAATDDGVDDGGAFEVLGCSFLGDRERQADGVPDLHAEGARDVVGKDGMVGGEAAVLSARRDSGGVQRSCLSARVNREACPIRGCDVQLVQGIDGDKMIAVGDPVREGLHGDVDFVVRGRLREYVGGDVLIEGGRGATEGHRLNVGGVAQPGRGLVPLGGRDIPEGDRADRDDDRQGDQDDSGESPPETLARITRGDAEYHSPSPHPCAESTH